MSAPLRVFDGATVRLDTLGRRARLARKRRGWTQSQVAEAAGTDASRISRLETGCCGGPKKFTLAALARLAAALDADAVWLLTGVGDPPAKQSDVDADAARWLRRVRRSA